MSNFRHLTLVGLLLAVALLPVAADTPAADPPPVEQAQTLNPFYQRAARQVQALAGMFLEGGLEQYAALADLVHTRYPTLFDELSRLLFAEQPDLLAGILPALAPLIETSYPEVALIVTQVVEGNAALQVRLSQLVSEQYPTFLSDLAAIPPGPEQKEQAAALIRDRYPNLLTSLVELLRREFPEVLQGVQEEILRRYPRILGDVARLLAQRYPRLAAKVMSFIITHYPQLLPQIVAILYSAPQPAATPAPVPESPPPPPPPAPAAE